MRRASLPFLLIAFVFVLIGAIGVFAADSIGVVGQAFSDFCQKKFGLDPAIVLTIWGVIIVGVKILLRIILKAIPTTIQGPISGIFWMIAKGLFGSGVVLENNTDPNYVKDELKKRFPTLTIEIPNVEPYKPA